MHIAPIANKHHNPGMSTNFDPELDGIENGIEPGIDSSPKQDTIQDTGNDRTPGMMYRAGLNECFPFSKYASITAEESNANDKIRMAIQTEISTKNTSNFAYVDSDALHLQQNQLFFRNMTANRMRQELVEYELETHRMNRTLRADRNAAIRLQNLTHAGNQKKQIADRIIAIEHERFVANAKNTFLETEQKKKRLKCKPTEYTMNNEDIYQLGKLMKSKSTRNEYFNYILDCANILNTAGCFGAYDCVNLVPMKPLLDDRVVRQKTSRGKFTKRVTIAGYMEGNRGKDMAQVDTIVDVFEKMMEIILSVDTDSLVEFTRWIETKGVQSERGDSKQPLPTFDYVSDAPRPLQKLCYLIRILFVEDDDGMNAAWHINTFSSYIKEMLKNADFVTLLQPPAGENWAAYTLKKDDENVVDGAPPMEGGGAFKGGGSGEAAMRARAKESLKIQKHELAEKRKSMISGPR
jgi:hypothetical protein